MLLIYLIVIKQIKYYYIGGVVGINTDESKFIEDMGLLMEKSGGSRTLGRIFGYLLLADSPRTLDQIAKDLLFSKATASLTVRQGLVIYLFEKVIIPGSRKDCYQANIQTWIGSMSDQVNMINAWNKVIDQGLGFLPEDNKAAQENLKEMKDYFNFMIWYLSDIGEQYERWKKGEIQEN